MKVTIITATYNSAATIIPCMASVLQQTYPDLEYWIVDGGSTDTTLARVEQTAAEYPYQDIHIRSEPDQGIYDALNKGIQKATGHIVGFVHSDDLLASSQILANIVDAFQTTKADGVYGDLLYVDAVDTTKVIRNWKSKPFRPKLLKRGWMPPHPTVFLRAKVYQQYGGFNLDYRIAADYEFLLRILKEPSLRVHYLPQVITRMRWGGASNRSLRNLVQKTKEDYRALQQNGFAHPFWVVLWKNASKIPQFFRR